MALAPELSRVLFENLELGIAIWRLQELDDDQSLVLVSANRRGEPTSGPTARAALRQAHVRHVHRHVAA